MKKFMTLAFAAMIALTLSMPADRKSTRLNSSHDQISYAVFCLKKKNDILRTPLEDVHRHEIREITVEPQLQHTLAHALLQPLQPHAPALVPTKHPRDQSTPVHT